MSSSMLLKKILYNTGCYTLNKSITSIQPISKFLILPHSNLVWCSGAYGKNRLIDFSWLPLLWPDQALCMPETQHHLYLVYRSKTKSQVLAQSTTNNALSYRLRLFRKIGCRLETQSSIVVFRHHSLLYEVLQFGVIIGVWVTIKVPYRLLW